MHCVDGSDRDSYERQGEPWIFLSGEMVWERRQKVGKSRRLRVRRRTLRDGPEGFPEGHQLMAAVSGSPPRGACARTSSEEKMKLINLSKTFHSKEQSWELHLACRHRLGLEV